MSSGILGIFQEILRSEGAGLGVCEGIITDDAIGSSFTFKGMGACEGTSDDDAIGSAFTFKGTAAATEGEEPIGELDGFISDAAGLPVSLGILSICKELRSEGAGLGACEGTDDDG